MIAIDELKYTLNRLSLLQENSESVEESVMAGIINQNLGPMIQQLEMMSGSPQFKKEVELETERRSQK
jgi:hypothetical protein